MIKSNRPTHCHFPLHKPRNRSRSQNYYLHLNPLDLDSPRVGGLVQRALHHVGDRLALREDVAKLLRTQNVPGEKDSFCKSGKRTALEIRISPEGCGGEEAGGLSVVVDV